MVVSATRTVVAAMPVAAWCAALLAFWPRTAGVRGDFGIVVLGVAGGALVFWAASALLGAPERAALAAMLPRRRRAC
jgi:hypothetical protein